MTTQIAYGHGYRIEVLADGIRVICEPGRALIVKGATFQEVPIEEIHKVKPNAHPIAWHDCHFMLPSDYQMSPEENARKLGFLPRETEETR